MVHLVTSLPRILVTPGNNLQCCSQHNGTSGFGADIMEEENTELWMPCLNVSSASKKEESSEK